MKLADGRAYYESRMSYYDETLPDHWTSEPLVQWVTDWLSGRDILEVAAGTGHWTLQLARGARSVVATEGHAAVITLARAKQLPANVDVVQADAYSLAAVAGEFDGAFMGDWYSHVPRRRLGAFFDQLHARLGPGAAVAVVDHLAWPSKHPLLTDIYGDTHQTRHLRDGSEFRVLKNFPAEDEVRAVLESRADSLEYRLFADCGVKRQGRWAVRYFVAS